MRPTSRERQSASAEWSARHQHHQREDEHSAGDDHPAGDRSHERGATSASDREVGELTPGGSDFAELLRVARRRAGLSQSALARAVGIDASYLNRLERAEREPPRRSTVEALAGALGLGPDEADRLLVAAGRLPSALEKLGPLDPTVRLVAGILADECIPSAEREEFRQIVELVARRWPAHAYSVHSRRVPSHGGG